MSCNSQVSNFPSIQETLLLHQRKANVIDSDDYYYNVIFSSLRNRVIFKPWLGFDSEILRTAKEVQENLCADKAALREAQANLGQLWAAVSRTKLECNFELDRLFPHVFTVVQSVARKISAANPPLTCKARVLLPRCAVRQPKGLEASNCVMKDTKSIIASTPYLCVTSFQPSLCLYKGEMNLGELSSRNALDMSNSLNTLLSSLSRTSSVRQENHCLSVLAAVTQALYTDSGCAVLWNYRSMAAVRLSRSATSNNDKDCVVVEVSGLYTDNQELNPTIGLLTVLRLAISFTRDNLYDVSGFVGGILRNSYGLVNATEELFAKDPDPFEKLTTRKREDGIDVDGDCWISDRAVTLFEQQCGKSRCDSSFQSDFLDYLLEDYERVLYVNSEISVLLQGTLGDVQVVTKYTNINDCDGSDLIHNEVAAYDFLRKKKHELLGTCVPDLLAIRYHPSDDPIIVLEFVGEPVTRTDEGTLLVGGEAVSSKDWEQIVRQGNRGLELLDSTGLYHNDESLGNVRVERNKSKCDAEGEWRVWWIDLGLASSKKSRNEDWYARVPFSSSCKTIFYDGH